jgi:hypothetical protein
MTSWRNVRAGTAISLALLVTTASALRADDGVAAAEALVRAVWYEGVPYEQAHALTPAGVQRLARMLDDPGEEEHRVNIIVALGMSENPLAYPALEKYWLHEPVGEVSRSEYRARCALPFALGHLARGEPRALALLERDLARPGTPHWSYLHLSGERLRGVLERSVVSALGDSGLREADALLAGVAQRAARNKDGDLVAHVAQARATNERVSSEGPARVFGDSGRP